MGKAEERSRVDKSGLCEKSLRRAADGDLSLSAALFSIIPWSKLLSSKQGVNFFP